jgi:iron complex transport system substrate-binding protein
VGIAAGASQKTQQAVRLGLAYIREHFREKCTLKEIAAASGRSPIYFHDVFKEIMNVTPYEYIAELRLEEAKRQLTLTDLDPAIIAEQCGYCSQSYFNFVFKKSTGMTPLHFRRAKAASYLGTDEVSE